MLGSSGSAFSFFTRLFGVRTHLTRFSPRSKPIITFLALPGVDVSLVFLRNIFSRKNHMISLVHIIYSKSYLDSGVTDCVGVLPDLSFSVGLFARIKSER